MVPEIILALVSGLVLGILLTGIIAYGKIRRADDYRKQTEKLQVELEGMRSLHNEKQRFMDETHQHLEERFYNLANRIFEERNRSFTDLGQKSIHQVIEPLTKNLGEFKKQVQETYEKETRERSALQKEIQILRQMNQEVSDQANALAKAIEGEQKTQGIWGEMILQRILELSGLVKGREFHSQKSYRENQGVGIPDVVVQLPGDRQIVIDSKVSLVSYQKYFNSEDSELRSRHMDEHLASLKRHIDSLAKKDYTLLEGLRTLDFVLMFVPVEGALAVALTESPALLDYALSKKVFPVGPSSLLAALKTIDFQWKSDKRNRGAEKIAREAGKLTDKIISSLEDLDKMGHLIGQLERVQGSLVSRMKTGPGNILGKIHRLKELGGEGKKNLERSED